MQDVIAGAQCQWAGLSEPVRCVRVREMTDNQLQTPILTVHMASKIFGTQTPSRACVRSRLFNVLIFRNRFSAGWGWLCDCSLGQTRWGVWLYTCSCFTHACVSSWPPVDRDVVGTEVPIMVWL